MANETIAYNKKDLRDIYKAFKLMDDQATDEARRQSAALAYFASEEIKQSAATRTKAGSRGSRGWFIYPTLRRIQPELINKWEQSFDRIIKEWV